MLAAVLVSLVPLLVDLLRVIVTLGSIGLLVVVELAFKLSRDFTDGLDLGDEFAVMVREDVDDRFLMNPR